MIPNRTIYAALVLLISGLAYAQTTSEPVKLQLRVRDTATDKLITDVGVKFIRDFPQPLATDNISFRELEPFKFFSTYHEADSATSTQVITGYLEPGLSESEGVLHATIPYDSIATASNLWLELTKDGYYPALRNLWAAGSQAEGLHLVPKLSLTPMSTSIVDFSVERIVKQAGIEIVIPPGACNEGTKLHVDVQTGVSGSQFLSPMAAIYTYPIVIWPPDVQFNKPVRITYTPDALLGQTEPFVFNFGRINPTDYSLSNLDKLLPNDGKSIASPFTYRTTINTGGIYVLAD